MIKNERKIEIGILIGIIFSLIFSFPLGFAQDSDVSWEATINFENGSMNAADFVMMGEATDANDGPPADGYDAPKSPTPPTPYIHAYFDDGLSYPNGKLTSDYRHFCDGIEKQWNLTIQWDLLSYPENIILNWEDSDLNLCPYNNLFLRDESGKILGDMRAEVSYTFLVSTMGVKQLIITAENVSCDDPIGDDDDEPIGDDDDDTGDPVNPGDDDDSGAPTENDPPIAIIEVNNQTGLIGSSFHFSGQQSTDDGVIQSYQWNLGNGMEKSGVNVTGVYQSVGEYVVVLTVTDEFGVSSTDTMTISVLRGNLPPIVSITGPENGKTNTLYDFSFEAVDAFENETLRFGVDWGDDSDEVLTDYTTQDVIQLNHSWSSYGLYTISVYSENSDTDRSSLTYYEFLVDILLINDEISGYLYDEDSDGIFDGIHLQDTNRNIQVTQIDDHTYSFQDANTMYTINTASSQVSTEKINSTKNNDSDQSTPSLYGIPIAIGIIIFLIFAILIFIIKYT